MTVYEHRATVQAAAGSVTSSSLKIPGGLVKHMVIRSNTDTTVFRAAIVDANSFTRVNFGFHTGELNDMDISMPVAGMLDVQITNASPNNETFNVFMAVQED